MRAVLTSCGNERNFFAPAPFAANIAGLFFQRHLSAPRFFPTKKIEFGGS
jgi:hypothetical protein